MTRHHIVFKPAEISLADDTMAQYHTWFAALRLAFEDVNNELCRRDGQDPPPSQRSNQEPK
jgi:hypothetical protein